MGDLALMRFILFTPEKLILSMICCAASSKSLAFQFANKTQQSQGQKGIWNWKLGFMNKNYTLIFSESEFEIYLVPKEM